MHNMAVKKVNGEAKASIKKINGELVASINKLLADEAGFITFDSVATMGTGSSPTLR